MKLYCYGNYAGSVLEVFIGSGFAGLDLHWFLLGTCCGNLSEGLSSWSC